jgi:adenine-specific DNA-methyltransferase
MDRLQQAGGYPMLMVKAVLAKMIDDKGYGTLPMIEVLLEDFSISTILGCWSGSNTPALDWDLARPGPNEKPILLDFLKHAPSMEHAHPTLLGYAYQRGQTTAKAKRNGVFYTPGALVETLCDQADGAPLINKKILDPSCGVGYVLCAWYRRLMEERRHNNVDDEQAHQIILSTQLYGMDVDAQAAWIAGVTLQLHHPRFVPAPLVMTGDFLLEPWTGPAMDVVAGNPPYVGHKQLDRTYFLTLKEIYPDVYYDKGDLAYCFFKRGWEVLGPGGILAYITSRYYLEAQNGRGLRTFVKDHATVRSILDFYGHRPMEEVQVDPAITVLEKTEPSEEYMIHVRRYGGESDGFSPPFQVSSHRLKPEGWVLMDPLEQAIVDKIQKKKGWVLEDLWRSRQGIITGLDKAFVLDQDEAQAYPAAYLKTWIKNSHVSAFTLRASGKYLLYTDQLEDLQDEELIEQRLTPYKQRLANRRECRVGLRPWHHLQWGRDPNFFQEEKIVYPYKSHANRFALDTEGRFYSADVYGFHIRRKGEHAYTNKSMVSLLNSMLYQFYFQSYGKKLGAALYEYYPNTVGRLEIPSLDPSQVKELETWHDQINEGDGDEKNQAWNALNDWVFEFFGLTQVEIQHVENRRRRYDEKNGL